MQPNAFTLQAGRDYPRSYADLRAWFPDQPGGWPPLAQRVATTALRWIPHSGIINNQGLVDSASMMGHWGQRAG